MPLLATSQKRLTREAGYFFFPAVALDATACCFFWLLEVALTCFCVDFFWFDFGDLSPIGVFGSAD